MMTAYGQVMAENVDLKMNNHVMKDGFFSWSRKRGEINNPERSPPAMHVKALEDLRMCVSVKSTFLRKQL